LIILDYKFWRKNKTKLHEISEIQPEVKNLFRFDDEKQKHSPYIVAGAKGYLNKPSKEKEITASVNAAKKKTGNYIKGYTMVSNGKCLLVKVSLNPLDP
jgi:response regulator RpfG family c-di-GMP phosphodiesterase